MFENPRRGGQARNFTTNVPKVLLLDLESFSEQIFSENCRRVPLLNFVYNMEPVQACIALNVISITLNLILRLITVVTNATDAVQVEYLLLTWQPYSEDAVAY